MKQFADFVTKNAEDTMALSRKLMAGLGTMMTIDSVDVGTTPKELVYQQDKMKVYRYLPTVKNLHPTPILVTYALVNRQYMLDLQADRSIVKNWLSAGLDVYIIDWGYPDRTDRYLAMEDYIDRYMDSAVDCVRRRSGAERINLLGVCQGGTMSVIYTALYPDKVKNLVTLVMPFDFTTNDGLLFSWSKHLDIDKVVDAYGVMPGQVMNVGFNMLKPFQLTVDKYVSFLDNMDKPEAVKDFLRMEKWIFDSPNQAGEMLRKFVKDLYQQNKLAKNQLEVGGRRVDLANITMPVLAILGEYDHLVPPASTRPFIDAVPSQDKTLLSYPTGHIGLFVSSKSQKEVAPAIAGWLKERGDKEKRPAKR